MLTRIAFGVVVGSIILVSACSSHSSGAKPGSTDDADASTADASIPVYGPLDTTTSGLGPYVDPFLGTGDATSSAPVANGLNGGTFPGATTPFGMVQFSPDTPNQQPPGYHYTDSTITGFSLTHLNGAGCGALRDLPIFPSVGRPDFTKEWSDTFAHTNEKASPGFYEVTLGSGTQVDLTATQRTGLGRFTFPDGSDAYVTLTGGHKSDTTLYEFTGFSAHVQGSDTVTGERDGGHFCLTDSKYRLFYALKFDRAFESSGIADKNGVATDGARDTSNTTDQVYFRFATSPSRIVHVKIGLSYVSADAAMANLNSENPNWDFDAVHAKTLADWNARLGKVQVEGTDDVARKALYTGLYHALVQPAVQSDVDGSYMGFDDKVHVDAVHPRYSNFSGWDVYRSWVHLAAILAPQETSDFVRSLMGAGNECGALPRWALANDDSGMMTGDPSSPTIAGAYAFGARDFDAKAALASMVKNGSDPTAKCNQAVARPCLTEYLANGFCAGADDGYGLHGYVSTVEEYAISDFAVAQLAAAVGDSANHTAFLGRSSNWKNVFDTTAVGGPLPSVRNADVGGQPSFVTSTPSTVSGFTEGNAAQYTFMVPQNPAGLIALLGGDTATIARLDSLFSQLNAGVTQPNFYMGDEPQFATPWLYSFAGAPYKTENIVRQILTTVYSTAPGGLPGNDDLGATSAWQVWALLGMYPVVPGTGTLVLGTPWFPKTTITLQSGKQLVITQTGGDVNSPYVQSLKIGGQPATRSYVTWDEIQNGQTLDFVLGSTANTSFGSAPSDRPPTP